MIGAIQSGRTPHLFLLRYSLPFAIIDLALLPSHFLVEPIVIKRPPLGPRARRAGWVGCNLSLKLLPKTAFVHYIAAGKPHSVDSVMNAWRKGASIASIPDSKDRGWLAMTLSLIERLGQTRFSLNDVYAYEGFLAGLFPRNRNIRPKIRQQLQILRDLGQIAFLGNGNYALVESLE